MAPEKGVHVGRPSEDSPEIREQAVELIMVSGRIFAEVARDLNINDTTLGNWNKAERGVPDETGLLSLTAAERDELTGLRRENAKLRPERRSLRKGGGLLCDGVEQVTRFAIIDRERAHHDVRTLSRLLGVSRSGFFAWLARPASARAVADAVLTGQVKAVFTTNRDVYGAPRIHAELADVGARVGRMKVARLMRVAGLQGAYRRAS